MIEWRTSLISLGQSTPQLMRENIAMSEILTSSQLSRTVEKTKKFQPEPELWLKT